MYHRDRQSTKAQPNTQENLYTDISNLQGKDGLTIQ